MDTQNQRAQYYQKQESLSQFIKSQFLKKAVTKLILSVSVFSLFCSHTTLISFLHYFNFYFSTLPFKLFSHTLDKNCTFLLCNGLLVFLAKYSGLFSLSSSPSNNNKFNLTVDHHETFKNYADGDDSQPQTTIMETTTDEVPIMLEQESELEGTQTQQKQNAMQQENENIEGEAAKAETETEETHEEQEKEEAEEESAVLQEDKEEEEAEAESRFFIEEIDDDEVEEEEEEEGNGKLSDEELNKKFEDFIRKMKEELRIEARQQLIMV